MIITIMKRNKKRNTFEGPKKVSAISLLLKTSIEPNFKEFMGITVRKQKYTQFLKLNPMFLRVKKSILWIPYEKIANQGWPRPPERHH